VGCSTIHVQDAWLRATRCCVVHMSSGVPPAERCLLIGFRMKEAGLPVAEAGAMAKLYASQVAERSASRSYPPPPPPPLSSPHAARTHRHAHVRAHAHAHRTAGTFREMDYGEHEFCGFNAASSGSAAWGSPKTLRWRSFTAIARLARYTRERRTFSFQRSPSSSRADILRIRVH
jgi:hypothetical protein